MKNILKRYKVLIILFVFGMYSSCSELIEVEDISNERVTLIAPSNNVSLESLTVSFTWNAVAEAETYHLQVAQPTFNEAMQVLLDTTVSQLNFTKELETGSFEWRVSAQNSAYRTNYTTNSFTIEE